MKIAIIGAGALGLVFGGLLSQKNEVHLFDVSQDMVNTINEKGVIVNDVEKGTSSTFYPKAHLNGTFDEKMNFVLVLVKTNYTKASLDANKNLIRPDTYVITLQNGLGNDEKLLPYTDEDHLILGVTRINSRRISYNEASRMNHGLTVFGYNNASCAFVKELRATFEECNLDTSSTNRIKRLVWDKLFLNLCCNPYCAYFDCSMTKLTTDEAKWSHIVATLKEAVAVANAEGQEFNAQEIIATERSFCERVDGYPSMYQDIMAGRVTEIEAMNGRIAVLGKRHSIPTPENEWITARIHEKEARK